MKKRKKKPLFYIFLIIFCGVFVYTSYIIVNNYIIGAKTYNNIKKRAKISIVTNDIKKPIIKEKTKEKTKEKENQYQEIVSIDIDWKLFENYPVCGWIQINDEKSIDYPIIQSKDNEYYLHHLYDGTYNPSGSIFVDYRNDGFDNRHVIIYGHNMKDGTMFKSIKQYQNQEYANKHRYIYIATPNGKTRVFYVYSCHLTDALGDSDGFSAYQVSFDGEEWNDWINKSVKRSLITSDIEIPEKGNIITLSTCMSRGIKTERCVIHAIEISNQKLVEINE